jgi:hypothetical protein
MLVIDKIDVTIEGLLPKECGTYGDSQLTKQISDLAHANGPFCRSYWLLKNQEIAMAVIRRKEEKRRSPFKVRD